MFDNEALLKKTFSLSRTNFGKDPTQPISILQNVNKMVLLLSQSFPEKKTL